MRDSILMTVYDRPVQVLRNTLGQLAKNNLEDTEIVFVDDGSDTDYSDLLHEFESLPISYLRVDTLTDRPGTYHIDGFNNPAYAWNCALGAAQGERLMMLASDCMVQPDTVQKARRCKNRVWCPSVVDIDSGQQYLGTKRMTPYGWFASWMREDAPDIQEDEEFLKGIAFEDNDFMARLALAVKTVTIDVSMAVFHQSHKQTAYSDGLIGHDINERHICKKWGGTPWSGLRNDPLKCRAFMKSNEVSISVTRKETEMIKGFV